MHEQFSLLPESSEPPGFEGFEGFEGLPGSEGLSGLSGFEGFVGKTGIIGSAPRICMEASVSAAFAVTKAVLEIISEKLLLIYESYFRYVVIFFQLVGKPIKL